MCSASRAFHWSNINEKLVMGVCISFSLTIERHWFSYLSFIEASVAKANTWGSRWQGVQEEGVCFWGGCWWLWVSGLCMLWPQLCGAQTRACPSPPAVCTPAPPRRRPSPSGESYKRQSMTVSQSTGGAAQGNRLSLSSYHILILIPSRGREEVPKPHPCTGELQVRRHQGGAYLLHHAYRGRHALSAAPGTGSSTCSWTLSRSQPSEDRLPC